MSGAACRPEAAERLSMAEARSFDPVAFKQKTRQEWNDAAGGWRKWHHVEFIRDVAPPFSALLKDQTPAARERIWGKVTEAYGRFADATGRVRTVNEAVWVAGSKQRSGN